MSTSPAPTTPYCYSAPTPVALPALRPLGSLISGWKIVRAEERNGVQTYKVEDNADPFAGITLIGRTEYGRPIWKAITVRRPDWFETGLCSTPEQAVETVLRLMAREVAA